MEFVTSIQKASEWGVTKRMVNYWCALGKVDGAVKDGIRWKILWTLRGQTGMERVLFL